MRYDVSEFNAGKKTFPFMDLRVGDVFVYSETVYMLLWWDPKSGTVHLLRVADLSGEKLLTRPSRDAVSMDITPTLGSAKVIMIKSELKLLSYE